MDKPMNRILITKVTGVTFEGRQEIIKRLVGNEPCKIVAEPSNRYDPNALAVLVAYDGQVHHVGYVPREIAAEIAPHLEGEDTLAQLVEVNGGFEQSDGSIASYGLRIKIEVPQ